MTVERLRNECPRSAHDVRRISVHGAVCPKSVRKAYSGQGVRSTTMVRVLNAAVSLGLPMPSISDDAR